MKYRLLTMKDILINFVKKYIAVISQDDADYNEIEKYDNSKDNIICRKLGKNKLWFQCFVCTF